MSAAQVQRLEALLQRVQHNRKLPHAAVHSVTAVGAPAPVPHVAAPAPAPQRPAPVAAAPASQPVASVAARPTRDRMATPLEMAVEGELNRPTAPQPEAVAARPRSVVQEPRRAPAPEPRRAPEPQAPTPQPMPRVAAPQRQQPAQAAQPSRIDSASIAPPSKPIANVVSKHPSSDAPTFGHLLARSLRLRPR